VGVGLGRVNRSNGLEIETRIVSRIDPGSLSSARFHRTHLMQALCQSMDAFICTLHGTARQQKLPEWNPLRAKRDHHLLSPLNWNVTRYIGPVVY
jgi:hypothetical protein